MCVCVCVCIYIYIYTHNDVGFYYTQNNMIGLLNVLAFNDSYKQ